MSYRKHSISKGARRAHHKREKARRRKLRTKGGQVEPFGYADTRGRDRKALRIMSVTKGTRDGAPRLAPSQSPLIPYGDAMKLSGPFRIVIEGDTAAIRGNSRNPEIARYIFDRLLSGEEASVEELASWGITVRLPGEDDEYIAIPRAE